MEAQNTTTRTTRKDVEEVVSRKLTPSELSDIHGGLFGGLTVNLDGLENEAKSVEDVNSAYCNTLYNIGH